MILAGTKDPGILPRNVKLAQTEMNLLQRDERWYPIPRIDQIEATVLYEHLTRLHED